MDNVGVLARLRDLFHEDGQIMEPSHLRPNSVVIFRAPEGYENNYPFKDKERVLFLGEIVNMPGHGIFVGRKGGIVHWGYHLDYFHEDNEEEFEDA